MLITSGHICSLGLPICVYACILPVFHVACANTRVLQTVDQVADAIPVMENDTVVERVGTVVVEVVNMTRATLQQNGLMTTQLGSGNVVTLPSALFDQPTIPPSVKLTAASINNWNLLPPLNPNNRLRSSILSINLNVVLRNLNKNESVRLNFSRVSAHSASFLCA